jgi:hypothetical protein
VLIGRSDDQVPVEGGFPSHHVVQFFSRRLLAAYALDLGDNFGRDVFGAAFHHADRADRPQLRRHRVQDHLLDAVEFSHVSFPHPRPWR